MKSFQPRILARLVLCALFLAGTTACVSTLPRQSFNRDAVQSRSITVLPARASDVQVMIMNNPGYQFGLIGALAAEANLAGKRAKLRSQLADAGFNQDILLRDALGAALEKRGYAVSWPESLVEPGTAKTGRDRWGLRKAYDTKTEATLQLDINYGFIGYAAAGAFDGAPYRPTITMSTRMIDADGKTTVFTETFVYNNVFPMLNDAVVIEPDARFVYPDFDDLDKADAESADGLKVAIAALAEKIAERL